MDPQDRKRKVPEWLDDLDLPGWGESPNQENSGGRRNRQSEFRDPVPRSGSSRSGQHQPSAGESDSPRDSQMPQLRRSIRRGRYTSDRPEHQDDQRSAAYPLDRYERFSDDLPERDIYESPDYPTSAETAGVDRFAVDEPSVTPPRRSRSARTARASSRSAPTPRTMARPTVGDTRLAAVVAASVLSVVVMAGVIAARIGNLPDTIPLHLDAAGNPDLWGTPETLWRLPLAVVMSLIISAVVAAFLWRRDAFAARFIVGSTVLVQIVAWVAVVDTLW